jgi:hypothetical protein
MVAVRSFSIERSRALATRKKSVASSSVRWLSFATCRSDTHPILTSSDRRIGSTPAAQIGSSALRQSDESHVPRILLGPVV